MQTPKRTVARLAALRLLNGQGPLDLYDLAEALYDRRRWQ